MSSPRYSVDQPLAIEVQIRQEKASALRRTGDKLEKLIVELARLERELPALSGPVRAKKLTEYQQTRASAEHERWCLIVQREAMGLWNHSEVDLMYRIPPPVR
ncbi:hypothetical protein [Hyalangium rubrum]|uniref:Uncharacterized protein n=1 Tax=Hyalangium rubrum TaxID=3103134 RepID=A0ABU5GWS6_9BACT|nr:hypothetical protein [Hyalangium sp. s54d21]MDY7225645.1 hypothetical protein [Hyalangium sp. s54d21]